MEALPGSHLWKKLLMFISRTYTVKKLFHIPVRPSPAGMSLTKLSLGENNDVICKLFPPRKGLVSDISAGDGNIAKLFLRCNTVYNITNDMCSTENWKKLMWRNLPNIRVNPNHGGNAWLVPYPMQNVTGLNKVNRYILTKEYWIIYIGQGFLAISKNLLLQSSPTSFPRPPPLSHQ